MFPDVSPDQTYGAPPPPPPHPGQHGPSHPGQVPPGAQPGPNPFGNDPLGSSYDAMPGGGQGSGTSGFPWPFPFPFPPFFPFPFGSVSPQFLFTWPLELMLQIAIAGAVFWRQYFDALARFSQAREALYRRMLEDLRRNSPDSGQGSGQNPGQSWGGMPNMPDMETFRRWMEMMSSAPFGAPPQRPNTPPPYAPPPPPPPV